MKEKARNQRTPDRSLRGLAILVALSLLLLLGGTIAFGSKPKPAGQDGQQEPAASSPEGEDAKGDDASEESSESSEPRPPMAAFLEDRDLESEIFSPAAPDVRELLADELETFYEQRSFELAWLDEDGPVEDARTLIRELEQADHHGLEPDVYGPEALERKLQGIGSLNDPPGQRELELDARLSGAFMHFGYHLARGTLDPEEIREAWGFESERPELARALSKALPPAARAAAPGSASGGSGNPGQADGSGTDEGMKLRNLAGVGVHEALEELAPNDPEYQQLKKMLARYRWLAEKDGWPEVPEGPVLEIGDPIRPERLEPLLRRLELGGDISRRQSLDLRLGARKQPKMEEASSEAASEDDSETTEQHGPKTDSLPHPMEDDSEPDFIYTEELAEAVERFQDRHGLREDSKLGPNTTAALRVSAAERVEQITSNLERWRWLPKMQGPRGVRVNLAAQELQALENGEPVLEMRVVVGREDWPTPAFEDEITHVIVNPYWNVPNNIEEADLFPKIRQDPGFLRRNNYEVLNAEGEIIDPSKVNWDRVDVTDVRIRQRPGPKNALGQIKFLFPNEYDVYLHDTPAKHLFDDIDRAASHGCIRVEKPMELASFVLGPELARRIETKLGSDERLRYDLAEPLPVRILYLTAFVRDDRAHFRKDVYERDEVLEQIFGSRDSERLARLR